MILARRTRNVAREIGCPLDWPSLNLENLFLGWDPRITLPSISNRVNQGGRKRRGKVVEFNCVFDDRYFYVWLSAEPRLSSRLSLFSISVFFSAGTAAEPLWMKLKGAVWNNGSLVGVDGRTIFRDRIRYWIFFPLPPLRGMESETAFIVKQPARVIIYSVIM